MTHDFSAELLAINVANLAANLENVESNERSAKATHNIGLEIVSLLRCVLEELRNERG